MEITKGDERSQDQGLSSFGTAELESQRRDTERGKKKKKKRIIIGVVLLCLLLILLAVMFTMGTASGGEDGDFWLNVVSDETPQLQCPPGFFRPPLILVSLDGFRAEYLKDHAGHLPIINKLRSVGTTAPYMRPVYPTKTFPNHYSIVTGLYPESHGIVDNKMYDVTHNAFFSLKTAEKFNAKWYQGEPVWLTAMRHKVKTATFFWPGSDVAVNGTFPTFYKTYDKSIEFMERLSQLFEWLSLPQSERPDFYTLYLEEPDASGHRYGPGSDEVISALKNVDWILGMLMDKLTMKSLHHCVNLMIVSDHGMEEASCERAEFVSTYQEDTERFNVIQGPAARIRPARLPEDYFSFDYEGLVKNLSCRAPNRTMRPYLKENLPKRFHFANNKRIERGHLYMKQGWQAALNRKEVKYCTGGFHGSDNVFTNMQAIFIGYGPGFKSNLVVPPFENIELYNLMCDLLSIRPAPNNGTHGSLNHLLKDPVHLPVHPAPLSHQTPCEATGPDPTDDLQCSCASQTKTMETDMNRHLMTTNASAKVYLRRFHHPFGTPQVVQPDVSFCLLHHSDYLNGYSRDRLMPLWVSYTLQPLATVRPLSPDTEACVRADVRVPPSASQLCSRYKDNADLSYGLLHPPNLNLTGPESDSLITSNMAPMFPAFKGVWRHFHDVLLPQYSQQLNGVTVMSGPIFDDNFDGNADAVKAVTGSEALVPTHFFVILTSCGNSTAGPTHCGGPLRAKSFILPHRPDNMESCATGTDLAWVEDWLHFHTARVRDIELLTGLSFYHDMISVEETLQLKTFLHIA
ncbi:ectonucleotide pyrophosphatase/phosphodiesterase family member 1-like [Solea senegalensis]|uniref:Ectonucleotide pyrophosphatase/phosphodiesterase family member 1-like n=1 Tax=Solea senegalensis TaxID=28829 RepID=A0AAV6RXM7_SOLSE|nr:ectonucleotide pyrophosphatase/phosphodiesterase family member 1 [Solea senegalensis]KAG7508531.1 ectonucleotide pyrophosphatase/phosphodiesterase family member 1-like [Solea senegalensis]